MIDCMIEDDIIQYSVFARYIHFSIDLHLRRKHAFIDRLEKSRLPVKSRRSHNTDPERNVEEVILDREVLVVG